MPQAAPDPMVQALAERGLLATGGNIRLMPFSNSTASPNMPASSGSAVTQNEDGTLTVADNDGNPVTIDPKTVTPDQVANVPDDGLEGILPFLAGAAGAGIGLLLGNRMRAKTGDPTAVADTNLPAATGEAAYGTRTASADDIVDGEFTVVPDAEALPDQSVAGAIAEQKKLQGPRNAVEAMGTPPKYLTASEIAKRKAAGGGVAANSNAIQLPDEFTDFTPEELADAKATAQQLIERRRLGNNRALKGGKGVGRDHLPTSPGRSTEYPEDMIGHVARILREQKVLKNLRHVKP